MEGLGMEPLPKGANFVRAKTLWEIGLHIAGNPATPYGGNRDMVIIVGSGSGDAFRPSLRLATGSAILAEEVSKGGGVDLAFVNPSALLTQAYRGVGLFRAPRSIRAGTVSCSWSTRAPESARSPTSRRSAIRCASRCARIPPIRHWC